MAAYTKITNCMTNRDLLTSAYATHHHRRVIAVGKFFHFQISEDFFYFPLPKNVEKIYKLKKMESKQIETIINIWEDHVTFLC